MWIDSHRRICKVQNLGLYWVTVIRAAGFLKDKVATTHPNVYDLLEPYCKEVVKTRIVKDGNVITAGGVATSIDLGLYLIELFAGQEEANVVKKQIDYPYTAVGIVEV